MKGLETAADSSDSLETKKYSFLTTSRIYGFDPGTLGVGERALKGLVVLGDQTLNKAASTLQTDIISSTACEEKGVCGEDVLAALSCILMNEEQPGVYQSYNAGWGGWVNKSPEDPWGGWQDYIESEFEEEPPINPDGTGGFLFGDNDGMQEDSILYDDWGVKESTVTQDETYNAMNGSLKAFDTEVIAQEVKNAKSRLSDILLGSSVGFHTALNHAEKALKKSGIGSYHAENFKLLDFGVPGDNHNHILKDKSKTQTKKILKGLPNQLKMVALHAAAARSGVKHVSTSNNIFTLDMVLGTPDPTGGGEIGGGGTAGTSGVLVPVPNSEPIYNVDKSLLVYLSFFNIQQVQYLAGFKNSDDNWFTNNRPQLRQPEWKPLTKGVINSLSGTDTLLCRLMLYTNDELGMIGQPEPTALPIFDKHFLLCASADADGVFDDVVVEEVPAVDAGDDSGNSDAGGGDLPPASPPPPPIEDEPVEGTKLFEGSVVAKGEKC